MRISDWSSDVCSSDLGSMGTVESSMAKVAVSEALYRVADRCAQVMGGTGVSGDTVVEQIFREIRAFRIYDSPHEETGRAPAWTPVATSHLICRHPHEQKTQNRTIMRITSAIKNK